MRISAVTFSILALVLKAAAEYDGLAFNNLFTFGPTSDPSIYIAEVIYTLLPPAAPDGDQSKAAWMCLWTGFQPPNPVVDTDQIHATIKQCDRLDLPLPNSARLYFEVSANGAGRVSQKVHIGGQEVAPQINDIGWNPNFISASNECDNYQCGAVGTYTWANLEVTLSAPDPNFGKTLSLGKAKSFGFTSFRDGQIWKGDIMLDASYFNFR